jgi:hypothetical protein
MALKRKPLPGNVRRVISLGINLRGVTTNKLGHLVQFESEQERKLILLLERDPTVADYISQPETFCFCDENGRRRQYTPDFKVWRTDGRVELHEVTVEARRLAKDTAPQREMAARMICQRQGWCYVIHTDQTLPSGYEYANLDFLASFRASTYANAETAAWWLKQLTEQGQIHPRLILARTRSNLDAGPLLNSLYYLLWHGVIQMDWHQPFIWRGDFHPMARIWLPTTTSTGFQPAAEPGSLGQAKGVCP